MKKKNQTSSLTGRAVRAAGVEADLSPVTIGLDLGDKRHVCCVLDGRGKVLNMLVIKLRDSLVRARVGIINAVRFTLGALHP